MEQAYLAGGRTLAEVLLGLPVPVRLTAFALAL
jgi:hypothetical protein